MVVYIKCPPHAHVSLPSAGVTSESHPLYGLFMGRLSSAIYEWDSGDYQRLMEAKRGEMVRAGLSHPSDAAVRKAISREEVLRHCRRRTRGAEETTSAIEALLLSLASATDTLGVPLLKEEMGVIWKEQQQHVPCLQDPPNVELYTLTRYIEKGGVRLPLFRCARGSTSLESFHLHLANWICACICHTAPKGEESQWEDHPPAFAQGPC